MLKKSFRKNCVDFSLFLLLGLLGFQPAHATEMAITVDDLPISGPLPPNTTRMQIAQEMLAVFKKHHIQGAYGMINGGVYTNKSDAQVLKAWVDDGQLLGNHTYTHMNPNKVPAATYIQDIKKNNPVLEKYMGDKNYKFFRYPFLAEGNSPQKRNAIRNYLFSTGYQIAPVTVDFADWQYNPPYARCVRKNNQQAINWLEQSFMQQSVSALRRGQAMSNALFGRDIKQILLIHIGALDAKMLDKMLTAYENKGVKFIPLQVALNDPAYKTPISYADTKGFTFFNQVQMAKGIKTPNSVSKHYISFPEEKLKTLCR